MFLALKIHKEEKPQKLFLSNSNVEKSAGDPFKGPIHRSSD